MRNRCGKDINVIKYQALSVCANSIIRKLHILI